MTVAPRWASLLWAWSVLAVLVGLARPAAAETVEEVPNPRERDGTWVSDGPGALRPETVEQVNTIVHTLELDTSVEVAVVVVSSLSGRDLEAYTTALFNRWGVGKARFDNGLMLLWCPEERALRLEVGLGLEDEITDDRAGEILDEAVLPRFRAGDFDGGILAGAQAIDALVRALPLPEDRWSTVAKLLAFGGGQTPVDAELDVDEPAGDDSDPVPTGWMIAALGAIPAALGLVGLRHWLRVRARSCDACGAPMTRLSDVEDDTFLEGAAQVEEDLGSVDHDVWQCSACDNHLVVPHSRLFSGYRRCPGCGSKTMWRERRVLVTATEHQYGRAEVTEECEHCDHHRRFEETIARRTSTSSSGSRRGGSTSRGSGSRSFGGGRSGGGGASRRY